MTNIYGKKEPKEVIPHLLGRLFTTNGKDTWQLTWYGRLGELAEGGRTYHMRNIETGEELTQLVFVLKEENDH